MEVQHLLIPRCNSLHLTIWLVSNAMIDELKLWLRHKFIEWFSQEVILETWQENTFVLIPLHECVGRISISFYCCHDH